MTPSQFQDERGEMAEWSSGEYDEYETLLLVAGSENEE